MTTKRSTKRALLLSLLSLLTCVTMLVGSTFAWFTDSVTSAGNKIQSGTLKVDLELLEKQDDGTTKWASIKTEQKDLFNYDKWEPGYTEVKVLKVENEGNLALKWYAKFESENEISELADVIDVFVCPSETELAYPAGRNLDGYTKVGALSDFINTISTTTYGTLLPKDAEGNGGVAYLGIALKMQEEAGNEYQGLDLGGSFDITILATQHTVESDSFNNTYDAGAFRDLSITYDAKASTADEFKEAITNVGGVIGLTGKIAVEDVSTFDVATWSNPGISKEATIIGGTLSRDTASGSALMVSTTEPVTFDGVTFETVKGSAVVETRTNGANVTFDNCLFDNLAAPSTGNTGVQVYAENVVFTFNNCTFNNMPILTNSSYKQGIKLEFNNCTFNWTGDNCPGMIKLANYVEADIDLNNCKFNYTTDSQYTTTKNFISYYNGVGTTTIDFNNFEVVGTRNNDKIWRLCGTSKNVTINTTGTLSYTFNGEVLDFNTYLK